MKTFKFIIFIAAVLSGFSAAAQSQASEGTIEYQKGEKRAAIVQLPYAPEVVEGALRSSLERTGVKQETLKGMQVYKGARLTPTDGEVADLYFKVERKGQKEDNTSVVYLIVGRPNENVALRTGDDAYRVQDAKSFLNNLPTKVQAHELEMNIAREEENIKKQEKKLKELQDDQKNLERRLTDIQDRIEQNKRDQESANAEVNRLRSVRDALVGKRAASN